MKFSSVKQMKFNVFNIAVLSYLKNVGGSPGFPRILTPWSHAFTVMHYPTPFHKHSAATVHPPKMPSLSGSVHQPGLTCGWVGRHRRRCRSEAVGKGLGAPSSSVRGGRGDGGSGRGRWHGGRACRGGTGGGCRRERKGEAAAPAGARRHPEEEGRGQGQRRLQAHAAFLPRPTLSCPSQARPGQAQRTQGLPASYITEPRLQDSIPQLTPKRKAERAPR